MNYIIIIIIIFLQFDVFIMFTNWGAYLVSQVSRKTALCAVEFLHTVSNSDVANMICKLFLHVCRCFSNYCSPPCVLCMRQIHTSRSLHLQFPSDGMPMSVVSFPFLTRTAVSEQPCHVFVPASSSFADARKQVRIYVCIHTPFDVLLQSSNTT
jgi:hypothetical protein